MILIFILTGLLAFNFAEASLDGAKVFRVEGTSQKLATELKELSEVDFDFWKWNVIMAKKEKLPFIIDFFETRKIKYSIQIEDVGMIVRGQEEKRKRKNGNIMDMNWETYQSYDAISIWLNSLVISHPNLVNLTQIGESSEGRALHLIKISNGVGTGKKAIFLDGGFHAREWISTATATYIINKILNDQQILEHLDFYIAPSINPDGYEFSRTHERLWRKTRSNHSGENQNGPCFGVDPNRNFDYGWGTIGISHDKCSLIYLGPEAFSEPETRAVRDFILGSEIEFSLYLTLHSYGQYWLVPWGYKSGYPPDFLETKDLAMKGANALKAVHGTEYLVAHSANSLYPASGASDDWAKGNGNIKFSYTIELRPGSDDPGFLLPDEEIIDCGDETYEAVKAVSFALI